MNAKQIISDLYISQDLRACLARIRPVEIQEDVLQHTFTELLCKPEADILDLHARNKLTAYVAKMLVNMVRWQRSSFRKLEAKETPLESLTDVLDEITVDEIVIPLHKIHWYEAKILELYAELRSYRKVSEATGIPHISIYHTVQNARKNIKKHIEL